MLRPSWGLALTIIIIVFMYAFVFYRVGEKHEMSAASQAALRQHVRSLGLTDLVISTEARYTRHVAISDSVVISMDHPGAIEHFPSSAFFAPTH